jgi:hypothetical protein
MSLNDEFNQLSAQWICGLPALATEEHLQLDFKTVNNANLNGTDDKKTLARCISGFANSAGGIVIWGIDARKNALNIDCAVGAVEITSLSTFLSRLNELSSQATSPAVDGIVHRKFEIGANRGFAATLIPESGSGPHMAKLGENRYYKRNGQQFLQVEHFDLEDMFGRRQRPNLEISVSNKVRSDHEGHEELEIRVINRGRALAKHVGFFAELHGGMIAGVHGFVDASNLNPGRQIFTYDSQFNVVHPNRFNTMLGTAVIRRNNPNERIELSINYYCEHMQSRDAAFSFEPIPQVEPHAQMGNTDI